VSEFPASVTIQRMWFEFLNQAEWARTNAVLGHQRCFYAGAAMMLALIHTAGERMDDPEYEAKLDALAEELAQFSREMFGGRA
jgi:hypothetical protein